MYSTRLDLKAFSHGSFHIICVLSRKIIQLQFALVLLIKVGRVNLGGEATFRLVRLQCQVELALIAIDQQVITEENLAALDQILSHRKQFGEDTWLHG